jgi:hypothetical protein
MEEKQKEWARIIIERTTIQEDVHTFLFNLKSVIASTSFEQSTPQGSSLPQRQLDRPSG